MVVINGQSGKILFVSEAKGSVYDFEMYKQSGLRLNDDTLFVGDSGFQGICDIHLFSITPFKKPKGGELTGEQKEFNRSLAQYRIRIEHVNRSLKCFKILKYRYRNKQQKHLLRFNLICGIYNFEHGF
ncbi:MAG: transposase [Oscillospiraceae bacterium]|nr:transposase [Oscillospiraceae bacterium]